MQVTLLSTIAAAHLGLCFASFRYIPLSLIEEITATAALSTAVFGFIIAGTIESLCTYLTLIPVSAGIILACGFEPAVSWAGVALCLASVSLRGCKNAIQVSTTPHLASGSPHQHPCKLSHIHCCSNFKQPATRSIVAVFTLRGSVRLCQLECACEQRKTCNGPCGTIGPVDSIHHCHWPALGPLPLSCHGSISCPCVLSVSDSCSTTIRLPVQLSINHKRCTSIHSAAATHEASVYICCDRSQSLQGLVLFDEQDGLDSFSLLYHASPVVVLWLLAASALCEPHSISDMRALMHSEAVFGLVLLVDCGCAAASNLLTLCVIEMTSPLTSEVRPTCACYARSILSG